MHKIMWILCLALCFSFVTAEEAPEGWSEELWNACFDTEKQLVDFTNEKWAAVAFEEQAKLAAAYQAWYAKKLGVSVETTVNAGEADHVMTLIPPGVFFMGASEDGDPSKETDKHLKKACKKKNYKIKYESKHKVTISKAFWMGKFEVTQKQWSAATGEKPWLDGNGDPKETEENDNFPATYVSWKAVKEDFLSQLKGFSLPTEAQWEYACRAGSLTRYFWGNDEKYEKLGDYAWCSTTKTKDNYHPYAVGQKKANAWGLHDLAGNVSEWCEDYFPYKDYPEGDAVDPVMEHKGTGNRIVRGSNLKKGNYMGVIESRSSDRSGFMNQLKIDKTVGVRVVKSLD